MSSQSYQDEREIRILKRMDELRESPSAYAGGAYWGVLTLDSRTLESGEYEAALRQEAGDQVDGEMMWALFSPTQWFNVPPQDVILAQLRYEETWRFRFWCRLARLKTRLRDIYEVAIGRARARK